MSRVIVTGGLGGSGRWIGDRLASDGHEVMCVDQRFAESERASVDVRVADLTDRGDVADLVAEFDPDAVVHWGRSRTRSTTPPARCSRTTSSRRTTS